MSEGERTDGIVIIAYPGLGDFLRCHTVVRMLRSRFPHRPIDVVSRIPAIEAAVLMPEVRQGIGNRFRNGRLDLRARLALAATLRRNRYGTAIVLSNSWKAALVPALAKIPERIGWFGEFRLFVINRPRFGVGRHWRCVDKQAPLALAPGEAAPAQWPEPRFVIPPALLERARLPAMAATDPHPRLVLAPGTGVIERRWPTEGFAELARRALARGWSVWVVGSADERALARRIQAHAGERVRDLTGSSIPEMACQLVAADVFVGNNSGVTHLAAGLGVETVAVYGTPLALLDLPLNRNACPVYVRRPTPSRHDDVVWPDVDAVFAAVAAAADKRTRSRAV
jgi:heptosyltransferase-2